MSRRAAAAPVLSIALILGAVAACSPDPAPTSETPAPEGPKSSDPAGRWTPRPGLSWQYQLSGTVDTSIPARVFDVDGETTSSETIDELHASGARVICYLSAGSWEPWRSDSDDFPSAVLGDAMDGWPDERWLDVRKVDVLLPIMEKRIEACRVKGFDAVEPDNVDGYVNDTGFPISVTDQRAYNSALAGLAHAHGLSVGLKNSPELVGALEPRFDFAVVEECVRYDECDAFEPFVRAGKAVFHVEYEGAMSRICAHAGHGFSSIRKDLALGPQRRGC